MHRKHCLAALGPEGQLGLGGPGHDLLSASRYGNLGASRAQTTRFQKRLCAVLRGVRRSLQV